VLVLALLAQFDLSEAECEKCLTTGKVACISETQYYSCPTPMPPAPISAAMPDKTKIFSCNPGEMCADILGGCAPYDSKKLQCKVCNTCKNGFACTGLDTFATCTKAGQVNAQSTRCADGTNCDMRGTAADKMCVKPGTGMSAFPTCNVPEILLHPKKTTLVPITTTTGNFLHLLYFFSNY
jgi:hypothetical protein